MQTPNLFLTGILGLSLLAPYLDAQVGGRTRLLDSMEGAQRDDAFGVAFTSIGDIDGDGAPDFIAGTLGTNEVKLYSGATRQVL